MSCKAKTRVIHGFEAGLNGYDIGKGRVFSKGRDPGIKDTIFSADCYDGHNSPGFYSFVEFEPVRICSGDITSKTVTSYREYIDEKSSTVKVNKLIMPLQLTI